VQDNWEYDGPTQWSLRTSLDGKCLKGRQPEKGSIQFQDHGNPVHFRNVWVREIPSRYANTEHGTFRANKADVAKRRHETAARLFAAIADKTAADEQTLHRLAEVVGYANEEPYAAAFRACLRAYRAKPRDAKEVERVNKTLKYLVSAGIFAASDKIPRPKEN